MIYNITFAFILKMTLNMFKWILCCSSIIYTCFVLFKFIYFLSAFTNIQENVNSSEDTTNLQKTLSLALFDVALLIIFIVQHSLMANEYLKIIYYNLYLEDLDRSVYNICSSAVIHLLITKWKYIPWISFWNISVYHNTSILTVMFSLHFLAWLIILSGCAMMDISELSGIKQIYYSTSGRPLKTFLKSKRYHKLLGNMRHPSLSGFLIIFWVCPIMSLDRFLLAALITMYMSHRWSINQYDYMYRRMMFKDKKIALSLFGNTVNAYT